MKGLYVACVHRHVLEFRHNGLFYHCDLQRIRCKIKHDLTKYKFTCTKWFLTRYSSLCLNYIDAIPQAAYARLN